MDLILIEYFILTFLVVGISYLGLDFGNVDHVFDLDDFAMFQLISSSVVLIGSSSTVYFNYCTPNELLMA